MGIQGLLPQLKSILSPINIQELQGGCVAIDTYSWLHKGALSCSTQLCKSIPTSRHIDYCMHRVNLLRHYGVKPILVFDGGLLPMKSEQESKRARSRKENLARAIEHESSGNSSAAYECYQKAVDISPAIAFDLIQVLKREGISYIVAPYEADAQMAFLATTKQVDAVITEDSDLIAFGCPRIIYKMDKYGQGVEFQFERLERNKDLSFIGFSGDMLLEMCILSGCDYLPSLPGMGLKRAHALISKFKMYQKVIKHLRFSLLAVPPLYEESFKKAVWTFRYQRVYDSNKQDIVHLSDISEPIEEEDLDFLGPVMPRHIAKAIAEGEVDPISKMPFEGVSNQNQIADSSNQLKSFTTESNNKKLDLPVQKNVLTNYFCFASLEAKRKFRAPRVSPTSSASPNQSSQTLQSKASQESVDLENNTSPNTSMEIELTGKEIEYMRSPFEGSETRNPLEQSTHSIPKPCSVLRKRTVELGSIEKRSQNSEDKNDLNCNPVKSSYITEEINDDDPRKSIKVVKSAYFKDKAKRTTEIDINKSSSVIDCSSEKSMSIKLKGLFGNDHDEEMNLKRKASPNQIYSEEHAENKLPRIERYPEVRNSVAADDSSNTDKVSETKPDEKFGCKISHLNKYSDISEKSMDKFMSVISAFKFKSSGSRVSGLRAPLKDIKNVSSNRVETPADIGNFSYVPKNGKATRVPYKRR